MSFFIDKLRFWSNKVLPTEYEDSLSYYEVLNKIGVKVNECIEACNENTTSVAQAVEDASTANANAGEAKDIADEALANSEEAINTADEALTVARAKSQILYEMVINKTDEVLTIKNCESGEIIFDIEDNEMGGLALAEILLGDGDNTLSSPSDVEYPNCNAVSWIKIVEITSTIRANVKYGIITFDTFNGLIITYHESDSGSPKYIKFTNLNQVVAWEYIVFGDTATEGQQKPLHIAWNTSNNSVKFYDNEGTEITQYNLVMKYLVDYTTTSPTLPSAKLVKRSLIGSVSIADTDNPTYYTGDASANIFFYGSRMVVNFEAYFTNPSGDDFPVVRRVHMYFKSSVTPQIKYEDITLLNS